MTESQVEPYRPFPSIAEWLATPFDASTFDRFAALLQETREHTDPDGMRRAVQIATRRAAVDTGAIEGLYEVDRGFTYSVAVEAAAWESIGQLKGEAVRRAIEDALAAYEYVLDTVTGAKPITEVWVKEIHAVVCASQSTYPVVTTVGPQQQDLPKGTYKSQPNSPFNLSSGRVHSYAPVTDTPAEMQRLLAELRSEEFATTSPIVQASYAHYAFVCIHPFADGNGRVARALASVFLYREPGVPLVIFADQKAEYLDALEAADSGRHSLFQQFVAERVIDTIQLVRTDAARPVGVELKERIADLTSALTGPGGLSHTEVDSLGERLLDAFETAAEQWIADAELQSVLSAEVKSYMQHGQMGPFTPDGYRVVGDSRRVLWITVSSRSPATAQQMLQVWLGVARPEERNAADLILFDESGRILIEAFLRQLAPSVSASLAYQLQTVVEREFFELVSAAVEEGKEFLRSKGYLS
jgi:Fic family protein